MSLFDQIGGMLQQYAGANPAEAPASVHDDYDQAVRNAPQGSVADGIAASLRSDHTPDFGSSVAQMFGQADSSQRATILSQILGAVGPGMLSSVLGGLGGSLASSLANGNRQITPEQADRISPEQVQEMARAAEQHDPSVIDRVSQVYAEHPTLFKTLGTAAVAMVLTRMAKSNHIAGY